MSKYIGIIVVGLIVVAGGLYFSAGAGAPVQTGDHSPLALNSPIVLHKSLTCGCCSAYGAYLRKLGYEVEERNMSESELEAVKGEMGVPMDLWSCHTLEVDGYVAEGHLPIEVLEQLLATKPAIKGIGMPGMPSGSPGMPGPKRGDFVIHEINDEGMMGEVFMTL